ncbi:MAG: tryptophan--tRNA ligase [Desulfatirhabdiaceae bacterium]|nr:tryptophan--tRNA ligase [Desulfatirhabdiaceae bacterium]
MTAKKRILSGMRPTGPLHLGNYHGALDNWIAMQEEYDCFFFIADWHALTSDYENTGNISRFVQEMMIDWLSAGLSPEKCTLFVQSSVVEHAELFLLLSMITPVPWLERNPTYKDQIIQLDNKDLSTFGFLGYPVLQAADIIMYKANGVPVGIDQVPHIEITREIARRFNYLYGNVFPEPDAILTQSSKILGLDRRKMSKSYNNAIYLSDTPEDIRSKVSTMITDPNRARRKDPGNPEICNVFEFHKLYSPPAVVEEINGQCRTAAIGCVDCKKIMAENLINALTPIRDKRKYYEERPEMVQEIIASGNHKAKSVARKTMKEVRNALHI